MSNNNSFRNIVYAKTFVFLLMLCSCIDENKQSLDGTLGFSGKNRQELEKVLIHYENSDDSLKYKAAIFLIKNLKSQQTFDGKGLMVYDVFFENIKQLWPNNAIKPREKNEKIKLIADSLEVLKATSTLRLKYDARFIESSYLIQNIDLAFRAWSTFPWSKENVSFDDFCKYILPYKVFHEPIDFWREPIMSRYSWLVDSMQNPTSLREATILINQSIREGMSLNGIMRKLPLAISFQNLEKGKIGRCEHMVTLNIYLLRAMGIPARADFAPLWGNGNNGHAWCSIIDETGKLFAFDAIYYPKDSTDPLFHGVYNVIPESLLRNRKAPKVFRNTFEEQPEYMLPENRFDSKVYPKLFSNKNIDDVTKEYNIEVADVIFRPTREIDEGTICLSVFNNNQWKIAICAKKNKVGKYQFLNMGCDVIYLPITINPFKIKPKPIADPFFLSSEDGSVNFLTPLKEKTRSITLKRKYYIDYNVKVALKKMLGGVFQGANSEDFNDASDLYTIQTVPLPKTNEFNICNDDYYRYLRFMLPNEQCRVAEIRFYGVPYSEKNIEKNSVTELRGKLISSKYSLSNHPDRVLDGDVLTYFVSDSSKTGWVGFDLGTNNKARVTKIEFYPPNDGNSVEIGDEYELFYWADSWQSLGKQIAAKEILSFDDCPDNALFILRNLTKGKAERIFTYENNKQIWW